MDLSWWDYFELLVLGLTGVGIPQSVMFVANEMVGAGLVGILVPLITAFTALIAGLLGLERVGPLKVSSENWYWAARELSVRKLSPGFKACE